MGGDHLPVVHAHLARQRQQLKGLFQCDGQRLHRAKERGRARLQLLINVVIDALFLLLRGRLGLPILGALAFLGALLILFCALLRNDLQGLRLGLLPLIIAHDLGDIGTKPAFLSHHHAAVFRVFAQLTPALRGSKELFRQLFIQPVRGDGF